MNPFKIKKDRRQPLSARPALALILAPALAISISNL